MSVSGEERDIISINPDVFGDLHKVFSFRKDSNITGQSLPRRSSIAGL